MASWKYTLGFANSFVLVFLLFIIAFCLGPLIPCHCGFPISTIVDSEAERIAGQIDDVISFKGVSKEATINLSKDLKIGRDFVPYSLGIDSRGIVSIRLESQQYNNVEGVSEFGLRMNKTGGADKIDCSWDQIKDGASFVVSKESSNYWDSTEQALYYVERITIDATASCGEQMALEERFKES
jgi:hypothetical protein